MWTYLAPPSPYEEIPKRVTLIRKENVTMVKIIGLSLSATALVSPSDSLARYKHEFPYFYQSTEIAKTQTEKKYVTKHFCSRLKTYWHAMTPEDRMQAEKHTFFNIRNDTSRANHQIVVQWCRDQT